MKSILKTKLTKNKESLKKKKKMIAQIRLRLTQNQIYMTCH